MMEQYAVSIIGTHKAVVLSYRIPTNRLHQSNLECIFCGRTGLLYPEVNKHLSVWYTDSWR